MKSDKYIIPGEKVNLLQCQTSYPNHFFCEVYVGREVELTQEIFDSFMASTTEGKESVLSLAKQHADEFTKVADLVAGIVGLQLDRQFIIELLNENYVATEDGHCVIEFVSNPLERLDEVALTPTG
jgi:hypothetical protein